MLALDRADDAKGVDGDNVDFPFNPHRAVDDIARALHMTTNGYTEGLSFGDLDIKLLLDDQDFSI